MLSFGFNSNLRLSVLKIIKVPDNVLICVIKCEIQLVLNLIPSDDNLYEPALYNPYQCEYKSAL